MEAHRVFDTLWHGDKRKRTLAYVWLRQVMGLSEGECHIALFDIEQCQQVVRLVRRYNPIMEEPDNGYVKRADEGHHG